MADLEPVNERLRRLADACRDGGRAAAELDLYAWRREPDCPGAARVLLASLLARRGEREAAREVLSESLPAEVEATPPAVLQMLVALLTAEGLDDAANRFAQLLRRCDRGDADARRWLGVMALDGRGEEEAAPSTGDPQTLAIQLVEQPWLIASLVYAQKHEPHQASIALLREALVHAEPRLGFTDHHVPVCLALAELALLADDAADARRWAQRGLVLDPYSAPLAMVLNQASDAPELAPAAVKTLDDVATRFPHYPDVRAALIRREFASGKRTSAQRRLAAWLDEEPASPMAQSLQRELAA